MGDADSYNRANPGYYFQGDPMHVKHDTQTMKAKYYGWLVCACKYG